MNTTIKLGIASALALGGAAAADAQQITAPSSGASTVLLFAEILNANDSVVASYGANTGVSVTSAYAGTNATFAATANLSALFNADAAGDTLVWGIEGSQFTGTNATQQATAGKTNLVTTSVNPAQIPTKTYTALTAINSSLNNIINTLNNNIGQGADAEGSSPATAGVWDASVTGDNFAVGGISTVIVGTGTVNLYSLTGNGANHLVATTNGTATFSSSGLVFATATTPPPVPLPPAVWLLGSGLLGLAGVARRKTKA